MKEAEARFAEWRGSHRGRQSIPEPLWALATELAAQYGVFRTAQVLHLDYTKLKRHTQAGTSVENRPSAPVAAFVELMAPSAQQMVECVIEVEGPRGRLRVEWKGPTAPDLATLSRTLWESGA